MKTLCETEGLQLGVAEGEVLVTLMGNVVKQRIVFKEGN